ncbi:hypothetical protein J2R99_003467 [Rhodopseudomonas julia]|uniref:DUF2380 domain-containing protein n=1 Tax=Rhodopseudomonas julia TaxID=200617 RepID=A0ABU0CAN2_9BRAD|nr:DUF3280 domain-containing protein [Rhodopseudomonas julia]MDQ0327598.1 hypothetical protein [Rhodopseudomonas julia]
MSRMTLFRLALCVVSVLAGFSAEAAPLKIAVFDFELVNTSTGDPPNAAEKQRLAMLSDRLREALGADKTFAVVDIAPVRERVAETRLQACGNCDRSFAETVGADLSMVPVIHKMSELILNISIAVRDVKTGRIIAGFNADIRSNTDRSWQKGLDWLLVNRILPKDTAQ